MNWLGFQIVARLKKRQFRWFAHWFSSQTRFQNETCLRLSARFRSPARNASRTARPSAISHMLRSSDPSSPSRAARHAAGTKSHGASAGRAFSSAESRRRTRSIAASNGSLPISASSVAATTPHLRLICLG